MHSEIYKFTVSAGVVLVLISMAAAECPMDHFIIGCNPDGVWGTPDDNQLFVDCRQKYRNSDPTGQIEHRNWFYPMKSSFFGDYRLGEPGFDAFQDHNPSASYTFDPNHVLDGTRNIDYRIYVKVIDSSDGLAAVLPGSNPPIVLNEPGDKFNHSQFADTHVHFSYQAPDNQTLHWMTFYLYDGISDPNGTGEPDPQGYQPSDHFTVVFNLLPLKGDLIVDKSVDIFDLIRMTEFWLMEEGSINNDHYERADINRDATVDWRDFAWFALNWKNEM